MPALSHTFTKRWRGALHRRAVASRNLRVGGQVERWSAKQHRRQHEATQSARAPGVWRTGIGVAPVQALDKVTTFAPEHEDVAREWISKPQRISVNPAATQMRVFASGSIIGSGTGSPRAACRDRRSLQRVSRLVATGYVSCRASIPEAHMLQVRPRRGHRPHPR